MIFDMLKVTFGCFIDFSHSSADLCKSDAQRRLCISRVEASRQDWFTFKPRLESKSSRGLAPSKLSEVLNVVSVLSLVRLFVLKPSGFLKPLAVISHFLKSHTHTDTHKDINKSFNFQIFSFFLNLWILCVHFYWRSLCFVFCFVFVSDLQTCGVVAEATAETSRAYFLTLFCGTNICQDKVNSDSVTTLMH